MVVLTHYLHVSALTFGRARVGAEGEWELIAKEVVQTLQTSVACAVQAAVKPASEQVAMELYDLEHLELIRDPITGTKCLVAWGPTTCIVAFRGTANKQNAKHDAKVHQDASPLQ